MGFLYNPNNTILSYKWMIEFFIKIFTSCVYSSKLPYAQLTVYSVWLGMGCCGKSESVIYLTHFLWINVNVVRRCITNYIYMTYKLLVFVCKFIRYYLHVSSENTHLETKALIYVYKMFSSTFYQLLTSECWGHTSPYTGKNIKIIIEATIYIRLLINYQIKFHFMQWSLWVRLSFLLQMAFRHKSDLYILFRDDLFSRESNQKHAWSIISARLNKYSMITIVLRVFMITIHKDTDIL